MTNLPWLEEMRQTAQAATQGQWHLVKKQVNIGFTQEILAQHYGVEGPHSHVSYQGSQDARADAEYIAMMDPPTVLKLLNLLEECQEVLLTVSNCDCMPLAKPCFRCKVLESLRRGVK